MLMKFQGLQSQATFWNQLQESSGRLKMDPKPEEFRTCGIESVL